jgi:flagellar motor switch protein FliG
MSILARYRKPGGFKQLLLLIETSQPVKQEKLLEVVEKEDPVWAKLLRDKKINSEIILKWNIDHLATIFENMVPRMAAMIIKSIGDEAILEYRQMFSLEKYKDIKEHIDTLSKLSSSEIFASQNHLIETVRYLDEEKKINLRLIDASLDLSEAA